jgi:hypothetical protein
MDSSDPVTEREIVVATTVAVTEFSQLGELTAELTAAGGAVSGIASVASSSG